MASLLLLDTGYVIALDSPRDRYHDAPLHWERRIRADGVQVVTTRAVQLEIGAAFSRRAYRAAAVVILEALDRDPSITVVPLDDDIFRRALALFASRADKEWSLTDCVSFVVMHDRAITQALSTDAHFAQAGFEALLQTEVAP
ncbi:MAG: PIN domain-containing protein [Betaproteobacteria bacterium]|nr:PIN domain-containing protein [Betaproteobacteria bacterium]